MSFQIRPWCCVLDHQSSCSVCHPRTSSGVHSGCSERPMLMICAAAGRAITTNPSRSPELLLRAICSSEGGVTRDARSSSGAGVCGRAGDTLASRRKRKGRRRTRRPADLSRSTTSIEPFSSAVGVLDHSKRPSVCQPTADGRVQLAVELGRARAHPRPHVCIVILVARRVDLQRLNLVDMGALQYDGVFAREAKSENPMCDVFLPVMRANWSTIGWSSDASKAGVLL